MIILDTNVLSELMSENAEQRVLSWFAELPRDSLATTTVCEAELLWGNAAMPHGARRRRVDRLITELLDVELCGRVLPFDRPAAVEFGYVFSHRRYLGRPVTHPDAQIASVARVHHATVATRNVSDFEYAGVGIINPWEG